MCREQLLPFGPNWVPEWQACSGSNDNISCVALLQRLRNTERGRSPMLLCSLLMGAGGHVSLPSSNICQLLLLVCELFEYARNDCLFSNPLLQSPGSLMGRLSRSTCCVLSPQCCLTIALYAAVTCPSSVVLPGNHVGYIYNFDLQAPLNDRRAIGFSSNVCACSGVPLCELRVGAKPIFLSVADTTTAARTFPMHFSELRAGIAKCGRRRFLRKCCRWRCLHLMPINGLWICRCLIPGSFCSRALSSTAKQHLIG